MRQVFLEKGTIKVKEVSQPLLDDYSLLVDVHYSCISSGTEIATISHANESFFYNVPHKVKKVLESVATNGIDGTAALIKGKLYGEIFSLGYSCAGRVLAVGKKIQKFRPGDLVACAGAGYANHADLVCVPENLAVKIQNKEILKTASFATIGAIALQGIRRAQLQLGERVCVIGLGLLGQLTVKLAKIAGCSVIGVDIESTRLQSAKAHGADIVLHAKEDDIEKEIRFLTEQHGADATIVAAASKSSDPMQQAMICTRKKGRVVIVGDVGLSLERELFYKKEIDVLMSCSYGPGRYDYQYEQRGQDYPYAYVRWTENRNMQAFVELLEKKALSLESLIAAELTIDQIEYAYELLKRKQVLSVVLTYKKNPEITEQDIKVIPATVHTQPIKFVPATKDPVRVGFVGAGGFAKIKLMPLVSKMDDACINAVADVDIANSLSVCSVYGASKACASDDELFVEDLVDVVVIASPHKYHCEQALKALKNGKAVFLEKPMVTTFEQLHQIKSFLQTHQSAPLVVDYNRSFAPFIQKIKQVITKRNTPLMVQYRMNAGFIPKEHWIQTDVGAGRIIGEACHIIDLFCFLTEAQPVAVSVESLHAGRDDLFPTDNFNTQISFNDGSVCSLMYTALGSPKQGKERMEIFYDGKSIVMDDFVGLQGFGLPSWFNETVSSPDKGHETLINTFFQELKKQSFVPPIPFNRLYTVAELTLLIDQLVCEGGGAKEIHS